MLGRGGRLRSRAAEYRDDMGARVGGRNLAISWIAGVLCAGVVGALLWLALPAGPALMQFVGDGLRNIAP
ncbi:MAG: hypothetical protein WA971_08495 [Microbacterium sp.]